MLTPMTLTVTVIENGKAGWAALGALFLGSALVMWAIARTDPTLSPGQPAR
ncbi:hypothetical protein [Arthrobacter sp. CAN_C5]|uniref:hypothetical protein n=1 Tax=Arthrobacter sp. CAN_C5 TaxID=2760706 RepID=UPI001AEA7775|nr:hypothetical protein [Arthrobacter sp. CAN_C5]MBP2216911.1 hypothetical protein [Arthrobacter sp. CAN_C5]